MALRLLHREGEQIEINLKRKKKKLFFFFIEREGEAKASWRVGSRPKYTKSVRGKWEVLQR